MKFDDGLVADHLTVKLKIDKTQALKMIKHFFESVHKELIKERRYDISPLGILTLDENDKIQFKQTILQDKINPTPEVTAPQSIINETVLTNLPYQEEKSGHLHYSTEISVNIPESNKNETSDNMETSVLQNVSQENNTLTGYNYKPRRVRPGYKIKTLIFLVLGLIIAIVYFAIFKNSNFSNFLGKKQQVKNETIILDNNSADKTVKNETKAIEPKKDSVTTETVLPAKQEKIINNKLSEAKQPEISDQIKQPVVVPKLSEKKSSPASIQQPASKNTGINYYIILGTFTQEQNATRFIAELKLKGYDSQIIIQKAEYSYVGLSPYTTKIEAQEKLKTLKSAGISAWIMKK